jgi:hypothetical protein
MICCKPSRRKWIDSMALVLVASVLLSHFYNFPRAQMTPTTNPMKNTVPTPNHMIGSDSRDTKARKTLGLINDQNLQPPRLGESQNRPLGYVGRGHNLR